MPQKINEAILERGEDQPFINVDGFDFDQFELKLNLSSETENDLRVGVYQIENDDGAVSDPVTGQLIYPGTTGYEAAARSINNVFAELSTREDNLTTSSADSEESSGISRLAYFIENESSGETFFSFVEANLDDQEYFQGFGDGSIGIKDELNKEDFDDLLISFDVNPLI